MPLRALPIFTAASLAAVTPAAAEDIAVPSGQVVRYIESFLDPRGTEGLTVRFRFLAPGIAKDAASPVSFEDAIDDMMWLCENFALARLSGLAEQAQQIVVTLTDMPVPFGEITPEATQFFEAYRPEGDACIWEGF